MNKIVKNIIIVIIAILSILGIIFLIGFGQEKPVSNTKEDSTSESVVVEKPLESIESVEPTETNEPNSSPEIKNSLGLKAKPTETELEVRQEMLDSFNTNLIGIGFVVYDEDFNGFILNMTNEDVIIEVAKALDGNKAYWNSQIRDPYIEISEYIQEQLGGTHPFMLKNPANDSYLLIVINGIVAYDEINGIDVSAE